jgi:hypothetical protein
MPLNSDDPSFRVAARRRTVALRLLRLARAAAAPGRRESRSASRCAAVGWVEPEIREERGFIPVETDRPSRRSAAGPAAHWHSAGTADRRAVPQSESLPSLVSASGRLRLESCMIAAASVTLTVLGLLAP